MNKDHISQHLSGLLVKPPRKGGRTALASVRITNHADLTSTLADEGVWLTLRSGSARAALRCLCRPLQFSQLSTSEGGAEQSACRASQRT